MAAEEDRDSDSVLTLNDQSFPLICTWDHFLRLLENTALALDRQNFSEKEEADSSFRHEVASTRYQHPPQLVDFYAFKLDYWPRFPQTYTKGLSVHLVFAEIMGVIKGSESSRESLVPLSREDYLKRSSRLAPSFALEAERSRVYDVFESYQAMKCQYQDFDYVDRVVKILAVLRRDSSLMQILRATFDEVYIDEVQDQRCLDLELLLNIVRDGRGFHFAGDTAQAISQDSTFRFADVKKMLFDHFAFAGEAANQHQLGHAKMFTLSKNYRSHQGILTLASLIMEMIWNGFPETVDKLEPEVGNLSGPKPVLFIGCDTSILRSSTVASGKLSERSADFGAEQVILVRDPYMKANLQDKIGDVVLIFTILESKGMEFDDVILWNFFSECPDQPGIRSLTTLHNDSAIFDSKKNSGMCSELKHFYVAVTRARIQLFIVESSEDTAASVLKLLTPDASAGLVDITRPGQNDFSLRVEMMRPSTSVDPAGWARRADDLMQRRMFKEALMPFRRAGDRRGEAIALGFLKEEEGRFCQAKDDMEGFTRNLEVAFEHFLEVKLIGDAVRVLVTLGNLEKAAGVWLEHNNPLKAAALFSKSGHYLKAHECYHVAREYTEAAAMLQVAKEYDRLVLYLDNNRQSIPVQAIQGYRVFCKLLLKQKKLSFDNRKHATKIIGCQEEQEACFREYGMDEDLAELFNDQQRYRELYYLYSRNGQLGKALEIALANNLLQLDAQISEAGVLQLLDYLWAFHLGKRSQESFANKLRTPSVTLTPKMLLKVEQWEAVQTTYMSQETDARKIFASPQNTMAELFVGLQKILDDKAINRASSLDNLGFEMMHEAVEFTKGLVLNKNSEVYSAVLLLAGVWKPPDVQHQYLLLPWSPLRGTVADVGTVDMPQITKQWVLGKLALAIQALDLKARDLWSLKWPTRCITFLTRGTTLNGRLH